MNRKASAIFLAATVFSLLVGAPAAADPITYQGSDTEDSVNVRYTITTDGTLGLLSLSNILASSITFTGTASSGPYDFASFTAYNNVYFSDQTNNVSPLSATATQLLFDFGGSGGLNFVTANCDVINCSAYSSPDPAPNDTVAGMVYALASVNIGDGDAVVYRSVGAGGDRVGATMELDNGNIYPDSYLHAGTFTLVDPSRQVIASVVASAATVPEPSSWSLMLLSMGVALIIRRRASANLRMRPMSKFRTAVPLAM